MENLARSLLLDEYAERRDRNPLYSVRAFARDMGINRTTLSEVLTKKRTLSAKNIKKLSNKLSLSPLESQALVDSQKSKPLGMEDEDYLKLMDDEFKLISDWYYFAILNLAKVKGAKADPIWIRERLGLTEFEVENALERLQRLGFLKIEKGKLIRTAEPIRTNTDVPSSALRSHHEQHLKNACKKIYEVELDRREFSSMTMAIDPSKIPEAKKLLLKYKRKIANLLETDNPTDVYLFSVNLFPLTNEESQ
ncbi:MAG: TIGR02147 family protein [Halobacteriovoraceae bacterium]|nr:TIGR02147 family protein [Halobacteriovoraceae bacterium]MBT5094921.1 TIGR02147 family protein [Halobacteriovoraceae bacterium]